MCETLGNVELHHTAAGIDFIDVGGRPHVELAGVIEFLSGYIEQMYGLPRDPNMTEQQMTDYIVNNLDHDNGVSLVGSLAVLRAIGDVYDGLTSGPTLADAFREFLDPVQPVSPTPPTLRVVKDEEPPETFGQYL